MAWRSIGISYSMGGAGVLVSHKRHDAIAELIDTLIEDLSMRQQVIGGQHRRRTEWPSN